MEGLLENKRTLNGKVKEKEKDGCWLYRVPRERRTRVRFLETGKAAFELRSAAQRYSDRAKKSNRFRTASNTSRRKMETPEVLLLKVDVAAIGNMSTWNSRAGSLQVDSVADPPVGQSLYGCKSSLKDCSFVNDWRKRKREFVVSNRATPLHLGFLLLLLLPLLRRWY